MAFKKSDGMFSHKTSMQTLGIGYAIAAVIVIYIVPLVGGVMETHQSIELVGLLTYIFNVIMPEKIWRRDRDRNG